MTVLEDMVMSLVSKAITHFIARTANYSQVAPHNRVAFNSVAAAEEAGYRKSSTCP
jgi:hypothetical protein